MNAFIDVCRHEWRRIRRDRALLALVLLFAGISLYAAWNGGTWQRERNVAIERIREQEQKSRDEIRSVKPDVERNVGQLAASVWYHPTLPPAPLTALSIGQAEGYPYDARLHVMTPTHRIFNAMGGHLENPATRAARFDLAFVIVFLLPLFLLAGIYDMWTQERDSGAAAFLLSHPLSVGIFLAAKALVRGGTLLLSVMLIVSIALWATDAAAPTAGTLAALWAVIALYGSVWIVLALVVNVLTRRSTEAAVACGTGWLAVVVLWPALLAAGVDLVRSAPSHAEHVNTLRLMELEFKERRESMPALQVANWQSDPSTYVRAEIAELQRTEEAYARVLQAFERAYVTRRRLADNLRYLSPAVTAQDALDRLAGTDADRALAFQEQVRDFLRQLRRLAFPYLVGERTVSPQSSPARVPEFVFREPAANVARQPLLRDLAALLAFCLIPLLWLRRRLGEQSSA